MSTLHLMQAKIDPVRLARWSAEQKISDPDRAAHCLIYETFGAERAPKPFLMKMEKTNPLENWAVLAYTVLEETELRAIAKRNQKLAIESVMPPEAIRTTTVPDRWRPGTKLRFSVRVRPTQRGKWKEKGRPAERDIYLERDEETSRGELYCQWVAEIMERQGGASPAAETLAMNQFTIRRIRRQKTSGYTLGPDATISGALEVRDSERFSELLATGIGRHRAYGYGMMLLQPMN
jgi:CRISPR system Cascade subunit CasE